MPSWLFLSIALVAIVVFVGLDLRAPAVRAALSTNRTLLLRNIGYAFGNAAAITILALINAALVERLPPAPFWQELPFVVEVVFAFIIAEFINWLSHWVKHAHSWLWTFHLQHHVGRHYDTLLTLHTHGVDVVISGVCMSLVLFGAGFSKAAVDVFVLSYFVCNLYKHCHVPMSLGRVLDKIIVGPAYHRVHHTRDLRGNYGSVLTLFDVVFRTAVWPPADIYAREVGVTGIVERGFIDEMLLPLRGERGERA